jgi:hypothetical protein
MITSENKVDITPRTLVYDLLTAYPELEDKLIEIAPVFIKLKNPVLRKTIAKITTLKQASVVAGIGLADLINSLRTAAGQQSYIDGEPVSSEVNNKLPEWILISTPDLTYDAVDDLNNGVHPLAKVMGDISRLSDKQLYKLITPFNPAPLIQKVKDKGFSVWTRELNGNTETFITKQS